MKVLLAAIAVLTGAGAAHADEHADCPMASAHAHQADVDRRHDAVTGIGHEDAVHHFLLAADGGSIRLEVTDPTQVEARKSVREHLRVVARSFGDGDFALPMLIHDGVPPGVRVMKKMTMAIHYAFAPTDKGGEVRISTNDPAALSAIHSFLRFQIRDHGTGDPTE
jgi:hypothetical protein